MFGISEEQMTELGMTIGLGGFMLFMLFIILELAHRSKAGKTGTIVLVIVLGLGMIGFVAKYFIKTMWGI